MANRVKVVFFGNEKLATGVDAPEPLIKNSARKAGFEIEQHITGPLSELKPHQAKIAVLAAYGHIIPQKVLDEFPLGIINVHPSLLPKYRGTSPIESAILNGDIKTGVSIMRLTAGMDEGPLYKQKTVHLNGQETKQELTNKLQQLGANLIQEVLPEIYSGQLKARQQPHPVRATYSKKINKSDGLIDWSKAAVQLEREIRAYANWPKSHVNIGGKEVIILSAHAVPTNGAGAVDGELEIIKDIGVLMVNSSNGSLCIEKLQPVGKKAMSAGEFIRGYLK